MQSPSGQEIIGANVQVVDRIVSLQRHVVENPVWIFIRNLLFDTASPSYVIDAEAVNNCCTHQLCFIHGGHKFRSG